MLTPCQGVCPARALVGPHEYTLQRVAAPRPHTVADLLARDRSPRETRDTRLTYICRYCGKERRSHA